MKLGDLSVEIRKTMALSALARRKEQAKVLHERGLIPRNEDLPAGSPMHYACKECGMPCFVDEEWVGREDHCGECAFLIGQGWLTP